MRSRLLPVILSAFLGASIGIAADSLQNRPFANVMFKADGDGADIGIPRSRVTMSDTPAATPGP